MADEDDTTRFACMTRSDIARVLKISPKQAGRLMEKIGYIRVGASHRRVLVADFDQWLQISRSACWSKHTATSSSQLLDPATPVGFTKDGVVEEARRLRAKRRKR